METRENEKVEMKTLSSCMNKLQADGYNVNFMAENGKLHIVDTEKYYSPAEVKIANFYRFEGESDPSDNSILYAIETDDGKKGIIADAYGVYADKEISTFIDAVQQINKHTIPSKSEGTPVNADQTKDQ